VTRQFELVHPVRLQSCARQMRCTELTLMPTALAIVATVHRVASSGGSPKVVPVRRMIPLVPRPSSVSSTPALAKHGFAGCSNRRRSPPIALGWPDSPRTVIRWRMPTPQLSGLCHIGQMRAIPRRRCGLVSAVSLTIYGSVVTCETV
jgi:hypothetical protein